MSCVSVCWTVWICLFAHQTVFSFAVSRSNVQQSTSSVWRSRRLFGLRNKFSNFEIYCVSPVSGGRRNKFWLERKMSFRSQSHPPRHHLRLLLSSLPFNGTGVCDCANVFVDLSTQNSVRFAFYKYFEAPRYWKLYLPVVRTHNVPGIVVNGGLLSVRKLKIHWKTFERLSSLRVIAA